tara:strand:+ start:58330 stop:58944 length:615 start_codon:yes stop_codon:yes gene_type:complete
MKFYLSSYKFGLEKDKIKGMMPKNNYTIGLIPNALDFTGADPIRRKNSIKEGLEDLNSLGLKAELLDLKDYFGKNELLKKKLDQLGGVWVRGGNTFVLRQAMALSGFDKLIKNIKDDFFYGGYSAGICVLAPDLSGLQIVDDATDIPYGGKVILEGLGILDYVILPHYKSDHPEAADIDREVAYCKDNNIKFKTLRDGEVIIIQ